MSSMSVVMDETLQCVPSVFPQTGLSVGVLTVLLRGLGSWVAPPPVAGHHFVCYLQYKMDLTFKNT